MSSNEPVEGHGAPQRRPSALGGSSEPKKSASYLQRVGLATTDADTKFPARSPAGAVRTASGLTMPQPAEGVEADKKAAEMREKMNAGKQWHSLSVEELYAELGTRATGLTSEEVEKGIATHGLNELTPPEKMHPFLKFLLSLVHGFQLMMNVGSILCFIVYGISNAEDGQTLALGIMLIVVVLLTSAFQTYQEGKADKIMEELKAFVADKVFVHRDGGLVAVDASHLTLGDIIDVKAGDKVPADVRILEATDLKVNNASLTGENIDIKLGPHPLHSEMYEAKNIARSGCNFTSGNGRAIVFAIGDNTFFGQIAAATLMTERQDSLMKREIDRMILILSVLAVILGVAFGVIAIFFDFTWVEAVAFGIGIIVANVPEGLLSQLVVTLALTAKNLQKVDVVVTSLEIIETLGAVSVICSDKTGTLTCNRMTVSHVVYDGVIHTTPQTGDLPTDTFEKVDDRAEGFKMLQRVATLNTDAVFIDAPETTEGGVLACRTKGDASESAIIKFMHPYRNIVDMRAANARLAAIPFNSTNKWMLSINAHEEKDKPVQILLKGAPEKVLAMCTSARKDGENVPMSDEVRAHFEKLNMELGKRGERVLGFAMMELDSSFGPDFEFDVDSEVPNFPMADFTFAGFLSLIDPPRPAVPQAVADCQRAGIKVIMVTGDHPITALAIARSIGIITKKTADELRDEGQVVPHDYKGCIAVHGTQMLSFTEEDWAHVLSHDEIVFARTMPQQKQDIVIELNKLDHVVAMTGDGVNDAPALKAANVGVAMGSGTSVAKEAAQIVIQKDDFSSIVTGIRAGRLVFATLKKVITYVLVSNTPEILPFLFFVAAGIPLAIETIVILTIDLGTDIFPAIAMAYEAEEDQTMSKPPRDPQNDHLVSIQMIAVTYGTVGLMHTLVAYFGFFYVLLDLGFPLGKLFGAGLGFRDKYGDLDSDRQDYFRDMCLDMPKYLSKHLPVEADPTVCTTQFAEYRREGLEAAQACFFLTIIWGQIANILIRKTFTESILNVYRMINNKQVLVSIIVEIALACALVYVPGLNGVFLMRAIKAEYVFCTIWYIPVLIVYDELRKFTVRNFPENCWARLTNF